MKMKALLLEEELKTIDGCQKVINVWQYRQRNIWFAIQALIDANKESFTEFKKVTSNKKLSRNERKDQLEKLNPIWKTWIERMTRLSYYFDKITSEIERISKIMFPLRIKYFADTGKVSDTTFLYSGFIGQKSIDECKNKKIIY